jgi:MFS family permease
VRETQRATSFWWVAALLVASLAGASAPSPLYPIYQREFGFSALTLTAIYAVYAAGGLFGLLVTGRASDHVGRRPVVTVSMGFQLLATVAFLVADNELTLYLARILSGLGVGIGVGAASAWLVDLQPPSNPRLGGVISGVSAMLGLGLGAIGSGLLVEFGPDPTHLVYLVLGIIYALGLLSLFFVPDVSPRRPGWLRSLVPEIGVPPSARRAFVDVLPSMVAMWALAGLFLALGASLAISLVERPSPAANGLLIFLLLGVGAVASLLVQSRDVKRLMVVGLGLLIAGVAVSLVGVYLRQVSVLFIGSLVAGIGLGPAYSAILRTLTPLAPPDKRSALLAAVYVVVYASFSIPTILAGLLAGTLGLPATAYGYGLVVGLLASVTTVVVAMRPRSGF